MEQADGSDRDFTKDSHLKHQRLSWTVSLQQSARSGGIIGICLILICIACLLMFIAVAAELYLPFYKLIGIGLTAIYGTQVFLTIGGGIKFIPLTGVTLPLVSYVGSSVLSTFIIFGIMQELYIKRQNEVERLERIKERVHY
ncbi:MAG: FtsW/RodA/SpoVE family cell cycle protein [Lachnospiraceae bacterium]